jgi:hypothetical protein
MKMIKSREFLVPLLVSSIIAIIILLVYLPLNEEEKEFIFKSHQTLGESSTKEILL